MLNEISLVGFCPGFGVLKDTFPSQDSKMVSHNPSFSSISPDIVMMSSQVLVETTYKNYGSKTPINGNDASQSC